MSNEMRFESKNVFLKSFKILRLENRKLLKLYWVTLNLCLLSLLIVSVLVNRNSWKIIFVDIPISPSTNTDISMYVNCILFSFFV